MGISEIWYIEVIDYDANDGDCPVKRLGPYTESAAKRAESGVNRNMNHEQYYTRLVTDNGISN
jgi:hypothetical protein